MTTKTYHNTRTIRYRDGVAAFESTPITMTESDAPPLRNDAHVPKLPGGRRVTWGQIIKSTEEGLANAAICAACANLQPPACGTPRCTEAKNLTGAATRMMIARGQCPCEKHTTGVDL